MKKGVIVYFSIFVLFSFFCKVKATPSLQETIWYNPKTFECTSRPSFDEHGSIRLRNPWIEGNHNSLVICSLLDINNFILFQGLLILTIIPLLIAITLVNLITKKSISQSIGAIITTIVIYITLFCWVGIFRNLRTFSSHQDESDPSINLSNYLEEQSTEIKLNLLIGIVIPTMYFVFKIRNQRKLPPLTKQKIKSV
jgi:hypothetical protein